MSSGGVRACTGAASWGRAVHVEGVSVFGVSGMKMRRRAREPEEEESVSRPRGACGKRVFGSAGAVRRAHQRAGYRVRAYWCVGCGGWHATHEAKGA